MWRWLSVLAFLVLVVSFSNQPFAEQDLRPEIQRHGRFLQLIQKLPPIRISYDGQVVDNRAAPADFVQFWLRKGAHLVLYGALGLTLASALGATGLKGAVRWPAAGFLLLLVASLDEWGQLSVPGRTGRVLDVLADLIGFFLFAAGAGLCSLVARIKKT